MDVCQSCERRSQCVAYGSGMHRMATWRCQPQSPSPEIDGPSAVPLSVKGPGDHLHDAILSWVGESPTNDCQCNSRIAQMNVWGPAACREHLDEIVDWLVDEATHRGWWQYAVAAPGSRYFIKRMVLGAIKKAECSPDTVVA
jgi:hypothetical protein